MTLNIRRFVVGDNRLVTSRQLVCIYHRLVLVISSDCYIVGLYESGTIQYFCDYCLALVNS